MTDASRLRVVGGAAVLASALAAGAFYGTRDRVAAPPVVPHARQLAAPVSLPADAPRRDPIATGRPSAQAQSAPGSPAGARSARAAEPPRFDVVRMGARGMVVVAGRGAPGAEVVLLDGGREIGRARADGRGEWVILPADPLGAGARELSLRARLPGGEELAGPDTVLVVGPAPAEPQLAKTQPQGREELLSVATPAPAEALVQPHENTTRTAAAQASAPMRDAARTEQPLV
ncbi:MAG TPA: hypothetical protein VIL69_07170, partial [Roseomonas sp.]